MKESFQTPSKLFLVLEYCPCGNIRKYLRKQPNHKFTEDQARIYICEIILAIKHLHENNILYRDLKPDNVLIANDGHLKLADYGLSKEIEEGENSYN